MPSPSPITELPCCPPGTVEIRRARPLLGTRVEIGLRAPRAPDVLHQALSRALDAVAQIHALMSYQDPASELSRLNREAARLPQAVHPHTATVIRAALRMAQLSAGAFDPSLRSRHGARAADQRHADWRDVEFVDERTLRFHGPVQLDLGGIAKGYAVDVATRQLQEAGFDDFIVNAGGDLRVAGQHTIQLRDPARPAQSGHQLNVTDAALATSADYFSHASDTHDSGTHGGSTAEPAHLVDPHSGLACTTGANVTVIASDCLRADALTKVVLFAPRAVAEQLLALENARAVLLTQPPTA